MIFSKLRSKFQKINVIYETLKKNEKTLEKIQEGLGRIELRQLDALEPKDIVANEFRVFSQWGEDGIIHFLLRYISIDRKVFVEFGVQNYTEANTRFLLLTNNWCGLVIEANVEDVNYIKKDPIYWKYNLKVSCSFINRDNINHILMENGIRGEIGLLSVDIDGNDYWVWQSIDIISPAIVVIEYNFRFGKDRSVSVPYDENFVRSQAHHSTIYYGASLKALYSLAQKKGYAFVGCNSAGNNAFFVRRDLKPDCIKELTIEEGYIAGQFRESRDQNGNLLFLSHEEEEHLLASLPMVEVE